MKHQNILKRLIPPIFVLALIAATAGLFFGQSGEPFEYTNHRGDIKE
jgi:hypothetical protein